MQTAVSDSHDDRIWNARRLRHGCSDVDQSREQLVDRDRKISYAFARGMIHRIGYRCRSANDADFANAFDAERIDLVILLFDENHVDRLHVRIHWHMIVGEITES